MAKQFQVENLPARRKVRGGTFQFEWTRDTKTRQQRGMATWGVLSRRTLGTPLIAGGISERKVTQAQTSLLFVLLRRPPCLWNIQTRDLLAIVTLSSTKKSNQSIFWSHLYASADAPFCGSTKRFIGWSYPQSIGDHCLGISGLSNCTGPLDFFFLVK